MSAKASLPVAAIPQLICSVFGVRLNCLGGWVSRNALRLNGYLARWAATIYVGGTG